MLRNITLYEALCQIQLQQTDIWRKNINYNENKTDYRMTWSVNEITSVLANDYNYYNFVVLYFYIFMSIF